MLLLRFRVRLAAALLCAVLLGSLCSALAVGSTAADELVLQDDRIAFPTSPEYIVGPSATKTLDLADRSVKIGNRTVFIYSAEFHPWRLPVEKLWRDVLNKLKEAGFNTISIYTHWGLISPSPDAVDLSGINDLKLFLEVAKQVGLFVNVRLGPYINAETSAGGLPAWTQTLPAALRTNDTAFYDAWKPYIDALAKVIAPLQTRLNRDGTDLDPESGPVILIQLENEYFENAKTGAYVEQLRDALVAGGVAEAAFSYNEASALNPKPSFIDIVDFYGVDSYPQGFNCKTPTQWAGVPTKYNEALQRIGVKVPHAMWEFQAGSFDPYDGAGFDKCYQLTNERFARVFDHALLAQNFKVLSHYMAYGGTNWGNLAEPTVYTSYDYGAPLTEHRQITKKSREYGLLGNFLRSSPQFAAAQFVESGVNLGVSEQTNDVLVYHRGTADAHWYIVRQNDSTSNVPNDFKLSVLVGEEKTNIPQNGTIHLDGRDSKIISTNHVLPSGIKLLYSTAPLSFAGRIGDMDVVLVYGDAEQEFETVLEGKSPAGEVQTEYNPTFHVYKDDRRVRLNWQARPNSAAHALVNFAEGKVLVILADTEYAYLTRPLITAPAGTLDNILVSGSDVALVHGGYHFANVTIDADGKAHLSGQSNETTAIELLSAKPLTGATFNGAELQADGEKTFYSSQRFSLPGPSREAQSYQPPKLDTWRYADSLPEVAPDFDDSKWTKADKTSTNNAYFYVPGISTDGIVLFSDEYGYHSGNILWRGRFDVGGKLPDEFKMRVQGGSFFGASVWLNGHHLGSTVGTGKASDGNISASIPDGVLKSDANVLTVLHDSTGLEEWVGARPLGAGNDARAPNIATPKQAKYPLEGPKIPRGILSYSFGSNSSISIKDWRVQGNHGGEKCPDTLRKCLNEGGLHAEVQGWHLPGFDTSAWNKTSSLSVPSAGVRYFSTDFTLDVPANHDVPLSVVFPAASGATYRALLFINGWQFGRRLAQFGPQTIFPIPPGVLDPRGENVIGIALWSLDGEAVVEGGVQLQMQGVYLGDVDYEVKRLGYEQLR